MSPPDAQAASTATGRPRPRVATAPVNWINSDLDGWSSPLSPETMLDEMVAAGYDATEFGDVFPPEATALRQLLAARSMDLCGVFYPLPLNDEQAMEPAMLALADLTQLFATIGCRDLNLAIAATPERLALAGHVPDDGSAALTANAWRQVGDHLQRAAGLTASYGVRAHFHNHVGTHVETPAEIAQLLEILDPRLIDLCYDCGHHAYGGGDPLPFVSHYADRIGYVHLKDVDPVVLASSRRRGLSFHEALKEFVFCEFGRGLVDIPAIVATLIDRGYQGWLVVEQDTTPNSPTASARANRQFLLDHCSL